MFTPPKHLSIPPNFKFLEIGKCPLSALYIKKCYLPLPHTCIGSQQRAKMRTTTTHSLVTRRLQRILSADWRLLPPPPRGIPYSRRLNMNPYRAQTRLSGRA